MADIIERLRTETPVYGKTSTTQILREEAAVEIERLRQELRFAQLCATCKQPLPRDCPHCRRLWES